MSQNPLEQANGLPAEGSDPEQEPVQPGREPGNMPEREPGTQIDTPEAERPPQRQEATFSDPDVCGCGPEIVHEVSAL